ncbi:MAG TPA: argininosuccinate lyase [Candidatus Baltobacteraceae bacterium]
MSLQWGGRFSAPPDAELLAFGSSLEEDLVLAPFDLTCSRAHVAALRGGEIISQADADALNDALSVVAGEIVSGEFARFARGTPFEDIHGAIDARIREIAPGSGDLLHAGRSRNDQVATTLLLYVRHCARDGAAISRAIAGDIVAKARAELAAGTLVAGITHWQPAQPILLAFWLEAVGEMFARAARRFDVVVTDSSVACPLGSGAIAGSSLPLDRAAAARALGFKAPSCNAMDAIGTRDLALDVAHAYVRAVVDASRVSEELVLWCTPAFGYARLSDEASTGSSLMPQKRNPDPFELVRSQGAALNGAYAGALGTLCGLALSYHRDLQTTKALCMSVIVKGNATMRAFGRALSNVTFDRERMTERAGDGFTVATDLADALIAVGTTARDAHAQVGEQVAAAEREGRDLPLGARAAVDEKKTAGSTSPGEVARALDALEAELEAAARTMPDGAS